MQRESTGHVRPRNRQGAVAFAPCERDGVTGSLPVRLFVQHPRMDGEPLMDSESIGEVKSALAAFPGLADVAVVETVFVAVSREEGAVMTSLEAGC